LLAVKKKRSGTKKSKKEMQMKGGLRLLFGRYVPIWGGKMSRVTLGTVSRKKVLGMDSAGKN